MALGNKITVNSDQTLETFISNIREHYDKHKYLVISVKTGRQRSDTQNNAMHRYCEEVAKELNDAGYSVETFFRDGFSVPFSKDIVKDNMWRPLQKAITGKESTTKPTRQEYIKIYDHLNAKLAERGIHVPWPSKGE